MKAKLLVFMLLTNFISMAQTDDRGYIVKIGEQAPDFRVELEDGSAFKLSDQKGKIVMLQFTASWCGVCRKEMPHIEKEIWKPLQNKGLVLIGIDRDEPIEKLRELKSQTKITYPLALDPGGEVFQKYALKEAGVTRNVIIDQNGKIVFLTRLYDKKEFDQMKTVLSNLINQKQ